jgi:hypothetical protein
MNFRRVAQTQGAIFLASGLWPVFHLKSFEKVTGPKEDEWLVKTVGLLLASTGAALLRAAMKRDRIPKELRALGAGQSAILASVSCYYSLKGRISKIYLLDTLMESLIVAAWLSGPRQQELTA